MTKISTAFRLRIHDAGTTTPSDGTVDFTLVDLEDVPQFGGQVVEPTKGKSSLGVWSFRAVDLAGAVTANLADPATGRADLLGRLAEVQENRNGAGWATVNTGRLTGLSLASEAQAAYTVEISSERWVERRSKIFDVADTSHLWPQGIRYRWRNQNFPGGADTILEASAKQIASDGSRSKVRLKAVDPLSTLVADWIRGDLVNEPVPDRNDGEGNFEHLRLNLNGTDYKVISFATEIDGTDFVGQVQTDRTTLALTFIEVWIWAPGGFTNGTGYFWAPTSPPSEALPLHLATLAADGLSDSGHTWGYQNPWDLVEAVYTAAGVRYDSTKFDALRAMKGWPPYARRVTDPDLSVSTLVEEIYAANQVVPFLDDAGRVAPRSVRLPDASEIDPSTLFEFNVSNCGVAPSFNHVATEVVNSITVRGKLFYTEARTNNRDTPGDANNERDIVLGPVEYDSGTQEIGARELVLDIPGVPPRGEARARPPFLEDVAAYLRAETFDRFGDGPAQGEFRSQRTPQDGSGRTPEDVQPGDLVRLNFSTFPNLATQGRGGVRLVQIMSKRPGPNGITWEYLDAGPALQPLASPTCSISANAASPRHARDLTIGSVPAGARVQVRIGYGAGSDYARLLDNVGAGTVTLQGLPSGTVIRVQARAVAPGRVRSAWSSEASSSTNALPAPTSLSTTVLGRGMKLEWTPTAVGYGLMPVFRAAGGGTWIDALRQALPPGSASYVFPPQGVSASYDWGVQHIDEFGGRSSVASVTTSTSTARKLATPLRPQVTQGRASAGIDDLPPEGLRIGYGIEVRFASAEPAAETVAEVSTDPAFGSIDLEVPVPAGASSVAVLVALDEVVRYVRLIHRRDGFTDSDPSPVVSSKPTALLDASANDAFPGGFAEVFERDSGALEIFVQAGGDVNTDGASYAWEKNPSPEDYPTVDETSRALSPLPVRENLNDNTGDPPTDEVFVDGDIILIRVRFSNTRTGFGQEFLIRHVYGETGTGVVSLDRLEWYNPTSGPFAINVARLTAHLRVPSTVLSYRSVLKVQEWNDGADSYDPEATYTVDEDGAPVVGILSLDAPSAPATPIGFQVKDRINSWDMTFYDATGGGAGAGTELATARVVENILMGEGAVGQVALYATDGSGDKSVSTAIGLGDQRDGDGVFEVGAGAIIRLRPVFDAGTVNTSWTPDYSDGAAQRVALDGDTVLQVPTSWGTARPMNLLITTNGHALTFQGSRFYTSGGSLGTLAGTVLLSMAQMDVNYVAIVALPDMVAV